MSHDFQVRVAAENLSNVRIVAVVVADVAITVLSLVIVRAWIGPPEMIPSQLHGEAPREIARIDQTLIEVDEAANDERARQRRQLDTYGWVDRQHGVVRIPIERAFELLEATP